MTTHSVTDSFRVEILSGIHDFTTDVFNIALYTKDPGMLANYVTTDEVTGGGYAPGGQVISLATGYPSLNSGRAEINFNDVVWAGGTFSASHALIYNTSKLNRSVAVLSFGQIYSGTGSFTVRFNPLIALIRV